MTYNVFGRTLNFAQLSVALLDAM